MFQYSIVTHLNCQYSHCHRRIAKIFECNDHCYIEIDLFHICDFLIEISFQIKMMGLKTLINRNVCISDVTIDHNFIFCVIKKKKKKIN